MRKNSYWLYHRQQVDEKHENLLEKKPEEKLWRVIRRAKNLSIDQCVYDKKFVHRLVRRDLVKIGRVRFKIREICSPAYLTEHQEESSAAAHYQGILQQIEKQFNKDKEKDSSEDRIEESVIPDDEHEEESVSYVEQPSYHPNAKS